MEDKKTIAEKLREFANDIAACSICVAVGAPNDDLSDTMNFIADEIEAEQKAIIDAQGGIPAGVIMVWADNSDIPMEEGEGISKWLKRNFAKLPRDRAGDPWHIGDETDKGRISGFTIHELYPESRVLIHRNGMENCATCFEPGELERVGKEPVLDADEVEIKPGETLYGRGRQQHTYTVQKVPDINEELGERFCVRCYDANDDEVVWVDPLNVSHYPIVRDADGVPCNPNDEVWSIYKDRPIYEYGDMMIIEEIGKRCMVRVRRADGGAEPKWVGAEILTHEKPVFDADHVRICKGVTVWTKNGGSGKVASIHYEGETPVRGLFPANEPFVRYEGGCWNYAREITHREPDSLEKLRDFASEWSHPDNVSNSSACDFRDAMLGRGRQARQGGAREVREEDGR